MPLPGFRRAELLDFRDGADFLELGDECLCRVLRNAFFDCLGGSVDNALRLDQTETGGVLDDLDDLDLVGADFLQDDVELRLLFLGGAASAAPPATTATGAAALTPNSSSSSLTNLESSRTVMLLISSISF